MLKKTVTYIGVDGDTVTRDLYFNISSSELVEKEAKSNQTYSAKLQAIGESSQLSEIYPMVIEFLEDGYGIRTPDGDFEKDPAHWEKFRKSLAYAALMDEMLLDPSNNGNRLAEFITGMLPPDLAARVRERTAVPGFRPGADVSRPTPPVAGQPVVETVAQPVVQPPAPQEIVVNQPETQPQTPQIQQYSEPRTPDLPGQAQPFQQ